MKRFLRRRQRNERRQQQRDKLAHAQQIATASGTTVDGFLKASAYMLESRLLKATTDDQTDPTHLQLLIKSLTALRRQTLAERQQTHREQLSN